VNKFKFSLDLVDQSLAQDRFAEFVRQAWPIVELATVLVWNWHLDALCEYLEAVAADDGIKRLIINIPPRSGKSLLASVLWPAWVWIRRPATRWLFASYSASLSTKHNSIVVPYLWRLGFNGAGRSAWPPIRIKRPNS
jgi:hypothetical protein